MPDSQILIVGGGPAGLTTAGALKHAGLGPVILDMNERIGQSWEQRYDRLHLHTERAYSGLAHFPIPRTYPKYLSKGQYASYLRDYASHFDLHVVPNTLVQRVRQENRDGQPGWAVDAGSKTWFSRVVVIATGPYGQPFCPDWPGLAQYSGETLHSSKYRTGRSYQNRRVLVIGAGNSGMEIAADLVEQGAGHVTISVRSAPPIVPRDVLGISAQVFGILMDKYLSPGASDKIGQYLSRLSLGNLSRYGFPAADWMPFTSRRTPVIDVGFVPLLKARKVNVRPAVQAFTASGVVYEDQREEPFDVVIFATGFRTGLEQLLEPEGLVDTHGNPRFPSGEPTSYPGFYFMGFFDSIRGFLYESNLTSQRLAREIKRREFYVNG